MLIYICPFEQLHASVPIVGVCAARRVELEVAVGVRWFILLKALRKYFLTSLYFGSLMNSSHCFNVIILLI